MKIKPIHRVHITTLGCSKNQYDSDILGGLLEKQGLVLKDNAEESDIAIINTCGFITPAKEESVQAILEAEELKKAGKLKKILVVGCMAARYQEELKKELPEVDGFFGTEDYSNILSHLRLHVEGQEDYYADRHVDKGVHTAFLKIAEGCNHRCAYCAIPIMRGRHVSRTMNNIISEAEMLAEKGVKELILISQDTTFYGFDLYKEQKITQLVAELEKIKGIKWIRLHYFYPTTVPDSLIDYMATSGKVLPYLDIPLQHISDNMLKIMKRGGSKEKIIALLQKFRNRIPDLTVRTTFIVGHPGETESDFDELKRFVQEFRFDRLGVFTYSPEEGTHAFAMKETIPDEIKEERYQTIMEIQQEISLEKNQSKIGKRIPVIIDEKIEGTQQYVARTKGDSPDIDNEVVVSVGVNQKLNPGDIIPVEIEDASEYELYARFGGDYE